MNDQPDRDNRRSTSSGGIATGSIRRQGRAVHSEWPEETRPTPEAVRVARRGWATGVAILTTTFGEASDEYRGMTVTAFSIVSLNPPIVLVCIQRGGEMDGLLARATQFAISILTRDHQSLADRFAGLGPVPDRKFTGIDIQLAPSGSPVISGCIAWFDCDVGDRVDGGDHVIVTGTVTALGLGVVTDDPLLSYDGSYRRLEGA